MSVADYLLKLSQSCGVAGYEQEASKAAQRELARFCGDVRITESGSVIGSIRCAQDGAKRVLVEAHIDEIGMMVTSIDDEGFLRITNIGGIDVRSLLAAEVTVHGKERLDGVICAMPPHLIKDGESDSVPKIEDLIVDVGLCKERARELVPIRSVITLKGPVTRLLSNRLSSKAFDNRCCVAAILRALELLDGKSLSYDLYVLFAAQEETGLLGAKVEAPELSPDLAIVLDVTHTHTPDAERYKTGEMGGGPMIGVSPMLDRAVSEKLRKVCEREGIKYQLEVMTGSTGTNAHALQVVKDGIPTGLLSIPLRYMHTGIETLELEDVENTAKALAAYLFSASGEDFSCWKI